MADGMFSPLSEEEIAQAEASVSPEPQKGGKTPIVPVPDDAPPMSFKTKDLGHPSKTWPYHNADGKLVGYVARWDRVDDEGSRSKTILPVTFCDLGDGKVGWRSKGMPAPRPLMRLPAIIADQSKRIIICEGEKTADAAAILFPEWIATTPAHGAKSPQLTDFSPCAGRSVVIATDFDEPGKLDPKGKLHHPGWDFGDKVHELLVAVGAAEILHMRPDRLASFIFEDGKRVSRGSPIPDGWDLADALDEGWFWSEIGPNIESDLSFLPPYRDAATRAAPMFGDEFDHADAEPFNGWPFRLIDAGVQKRTETKDKETEQMIVKWKWFCSHLEIAAETRSFEGDEWGRLLVIRDRDDRVKEWAMPMAMLAGDGTGYRERLLSLGLIMAPGKFARDALHEYISTAPADVRVRCVGRIGWQDETFITFKGNIGSGANG